MSISAGLVKDLRNRTGAGILDCRKALVETDGDMGKAVEYLQKKSLAAASKKAGRIAAEGAVGSYVHMGGRIGVLCEINCETDFVAKTEEFQKFMQDVCMHIAAMNPTYLTSDEIPADEIANQRRLFSEMMKESGKPENIIEKIVDGKIKKWFGEICLMDQTFVKDNDVTVAELLTKMIAKIGENMKIRRFVRFGLGEGLEKKVEDFAAEVAAAAGQG
jgi:elongation factor Ts